TTRLGEAAGAGFGDAVTFAFGDPAQRLYGSARLGLVAGEPVLASGLVLLFGDGAPIVADATGGIELAQADWARIDAGDLSATIVEPLRAWEVAYDGDEAGFALRFDALGEPVELGEGALGTSAADLHGYEQLCRVSGHVRAGKRGWELDCRGQRGHQWGAPDWERIALARTLAVWLDDDRGIALAAMRPHAAAGHEQELVGAALLGEQTATIADPRLSTTLNAAGCQRRAGLELWIGDESPIPLYGAGEAVCGTTLDLGRLRLDAAFFHWHVDGHSGVGRYDVLQRA
ncbi:MAG: hypothetical protein WBC33_10060, partial [Conexibacter sp.]